MKLTMTQTDLQQAVVTHLFTTLGLTLDPETISVDVDDIEIDLNPDETSTSETKQPRRKRRSKTEIEAEKIQETSTSKDEGIQTSAAINQSSASTPTVEVEETVSANPFDDGDEPEEDTLGSIVDEVMESAETKTTKSIFD